jgi:hypothetical protein
MVFLSRDSQGGVLKLSEFGLPGICKIITLCSNLRLGWGLKQTCSSPREFSNGVLHSNCTHRGWVDSQLLVVGSQPANLTPDLSFCHNLCYKCPNGPCEAIFDVYTSKAFQWYKEHPNAKCFNPCNQLWNFKSPGGLPSPHFRNVNFILTHCQSRVVTLKNYVGANHRNWGDHLGLMEFCYNSMMHSTTKVS